MNLQHIIAEKFKTGELTKPSCKKAEFYKGGIYNMINRLRVALRPYPGAFTEYTKRTEDLSYSEAIGIMWDYVRIVDADG